MRHFIVWFCACFAMTLGAVSAQHIGEETLCVDYFGVGTIIDDSCRPFPGPNRKVGPSELSSALAEKITKLKIVSDDTPEEPYNLSPLASVSSIRSLDLYREGDVDLTPIQNMKGLRSLSLAIDAAAAFDQLTIGPEGLAELSLYAPRLEIDLSSLAHLPNLRVLYVKANSIKGQESLGGLKHLERATFELAEETDFSSLTALTQLKWLEISGSFNGAVLSGAGFLASLSELTNLDLSDNEIRDLTPLAGLKNLKVLTLTGNLTLSDISPLSGLTGLRQLHLRKTQVSDLSALRNMNELGILWLSRTPVVDLSPLAELPKLWGLELKRTEVTDITPLRKLSLKHLDLRGTGVTDFSFVPSGTKLKK
ncbi:internalin A [Pseudovibrio denitrificans]|uniref:Internalin A n=1 Tax=Pseudovibrio denitrificans TaxID=258256 RepID=A0A1I7DX49_9HYPH|nr:leucine-rich repeat domain-containing protein [Pseudovibrio denitrificans]SFU16241.1 internalin A [Pseudovibrio denitrificans]